MGIALALLLQGWDRVVIHFNGPADESAVTDRGGFVVRSLTSSGGVVAYVPVPALPALSRLGAVHPDVLVSIPDPARSLARRPPSPSPTQEVPWGIGRVRASAAWARSRGAGVTVAVVDTGVDSAHEDLTGRVTLGPNFNNPRKNSNDDNGHGTHVAGTIGAGENAVGVVGVAPECRLLAVKVLDRTGTGWLSDVAAGIDWAVANGAQVINLSLGSTADLPALRTAVDAAEAAGVIVVAAAGNSGDETLHFPAAYPSVISVSAIDAADGLASFSTFGATLSVAAPGVDVKSTYKEGGYATLSGTSMASPHAAGTVALMRGAGATASTVRATLTSRADDLGAAGWDPRFGYGAVNAEAATAP